jgi:hypothetical protein
VNQQLVFVEGIPGSGKTTTATWLADQLRARGLPATAYLETDEPHPLHAFWTWGDGYREGEVVTEPYAPAKFTDRLSDKAAAFVQRLIAQGELAVVEAYPFQLAVRNHLRMGASRADIEHFYCRFQAVVSPAKPLLVFLEAHDLARTFQAAIRERGADFEQRLIGSITRSPFGRCRHFQGLDGVLVFYRECYALVEDFLRAWPFRVCRVNPTFSGWAAARATILEAVEAGISGGA